jgi:hypothetical protein
MIVTRVALCAEPLQAAAYEQNLLRPFLPADYFSGMPPHSRTKAASSVELDNRFTAPGLSLPQPGG